MGIWHTFSYALYVFILMVRLNEDQLQKLKKLECWDDKIFEKLRKNWVEDPIYIWDDADEKEAKEEFKKKG